MCMGRRGKGYLGSFPAKKIRSNTTPDRAAAASFPMTMTTAAASFPMTTGATSSSPSPATASSSVQAPPLQQLMGLKTIRLTPEKGFPEIFLTYDFVLKHTMHCGKTTYLQRSKVKEDYFDVEFTSREGATNALNNCKIDLMKFGWAPLNITAKPPPSGKAEVSFRSATDYHKFNTTPSLPLPANNPFRDKWVVPHTNNPIGVAQKRKNNSIGGMKVKCWCPHNVELKAANPDGPFGKREWPEFPLYPPHPSVKDTI